MRLSTIKHAMPEAIPPAIVAKRWKETFPKMSFCASERISLEISRDLKEAIKRGHTVGKGRKGRTGMIRISHFQRVVGVLFL